MWFFKLVGRFRCFVSLRFHVCAARSTLQMASAGTTTPSGRLPTLARSSTTSRRTTVQYILLGMFRSTSQQPRPPGFERISPGLKCRGRIHVAWQCFAYRTHISGAVSQPKIRMAPVVVTNIIVFQLFAGRLPARAGARAFPQLPQPAVLCCSFSVAVGSH
jgi:hypothetical protein